MLGFLGFKELVKLKTLRRTETKRGLKPIEEKTKEKITEDKDSNSDEVISLKSLEKQFTLKRID